MKVLVTGGAGFIGSHVVDVLIDAEHDVSVVDNLYKHGGGRLENIHPQARLYRVDVCSRNLWDVFEKEQPEVVCHLAAQSSLPISTREPEYDAEINILGLMSVLSTCTAFGVRKVVFSSTSAVYGTVSADQMPLDEETSKSAPESPYGVAKLAGEHYLHVWNRLHGLDYTVLRYGNVYGPRQDPHMENGVVAIFAHAILSGQPVRIDGDGEQAKDYVYVEDVARANLLTLYRGSEQAYCIGTGKATSVNALYRALCDLAGTEASIIEMPPRPGDVRLFYFDSSKAKRDLEWTPQVPLNEGLRRTVDYYRQGI